MDSDAGRLPARSSHLGSNRVQPPCVSHLGCIDTPFQSEDIGIRRFLLVYFHVYLQGYSHNLRGLKYSLALRSRLGPHGAESLGVPSLAIFGHDDEV